MSLQAINWVIGLDLPTAEKFVLMALANAANEYGSAWPSQEAVRAFTCQSERTVRDALKALSERGLVLRVGRRRADGSRQSDVCVLVGFEGRKHPRRPEDDWVHALPEMAAALEEWAGDGAGNRQDLPVDEGADNRQTAPDQPANGAAATGKICMTNRHNLPVSIEEPSFREPSQEETSYDDDSAQARDVNDLAGNAEFVRQMVEALGDPTLAQAGYWQLEARNGHFRRTWADLGLSEPQMLAVAQGWSQNNLHPPQGPKAMGAAMARLSRGAAKPQAGVRSTPAERVAFLVDWLRKGTYVPPSALTSDSRQRIVAGGFFTDQELRSRGL